VATRTRGERGDGAEGAPVRIRAGRRTVPIRHPSKLLFPSDGISTLDLVGYYQSIAPWILPHIRHRPLMLGRYPEGIDAGGFYQKRISSSLPGWTSRATVPKIEGGSLVQALADTAADLGALAAEACISLHPWGSRADRLPFPDRIVLDLDPPEVDFDAVRQVAFMVRTIFEEAGLVPFLKTTGSRGAHVVAPILRRLDFAGVRRVARAVADLIVTRLPDLATIEARKDARDARVYLDVMRNGYGQTTVAPYSVRARPGAPVATPITWEELANPTLTSRQFHLAAVPGRLSRSGDPWSGMGRHARSLTAAARRLGIEI